MSVGAYVSCLSGFQGILKPPFCGGIEIGFVFKSSIMFSVRVCVGFPVGGFVNVFVKVLCVGFWRSLCKNLCQPFLARFLSECLVDFLSGSLFHVFCRVNVFGIFFEMRRRTGTVLKYRPNL